MKRLLVFQHVPYEILGTLDPMLRDAGFRIRYINFGRTPDAEPRVTRYDGLVVLGGPMNVDQVQQHPHLLTEIASIREAINQGIPVLGICLGAQLIAKSLGAAVTRNPVKEIGWYDVSPTPAGTEDPLFADFCGTEKIFQWHGDTFALPEHAVHLASSPDCANQAFRYGDNVYGLQFHLEVDEALVRRWLKTRNYLRELKSLGDDDRFGIERIRRDTHAYIDRSAEIAGTTFRAFLKLFHHRTRRIAMPSR